MHTRSSASSAGQPREQIEVGDEQSRGIGDPVGDGDDDVAQAVRRSLPARVARAARVRRRRRSRQRVARSPRNAATRKRVCASSRSAPRSALESAFQSVRDQFVKSSDVLRLPAQLIVEAQHFGDETRPNLKRQGARLTQGGIAPRPARSLRGRTRSAAPADSSAGREARRTADRASRVTAACRLRAIARVERLPRASGRRRRASCPAAVRLQRGPFRRSREDTSNRLAKFE